MARSLLLHGDVGEPAAPPAVALLGKGFRPFFLLAAAFAIAIVPIWLFVVRGVVAPGPYVEPASWHAHEMVFGFLVAVIAGFLLTAVGNWTGRETAVGAPLGGLALLWIAGRVAMAFAAELPRGLPALVDLAFLPALAIALARPLLATKNRRNFVMIAILAALFVANLFVHAEGLGLAAAGSARRAALAGVDLVLLVALIIAGRVFPMFTRNATRVASIRSVRSLDVLTIAGMAALTALDVALPDSRTAAIFAGAVGVVAALRSMHWGARHSFGQPLLWILHTGYAWLALGLVLRAVAAFAGAVPASLATHALTVGAFGALTLGMMARVSLGHTGRTLAPPRPMTVAFAAINLAAFARAVVPIFAPAWYFEALVAAGTLWVVAFGLFLICYAPMLARPRVDGKAG
jgi:uncharacterized protein involved in response to NO